MSRLDRLRCALGGHKAGPGIAWNQGYCFGHCLRCGAPIMRAVFGEWRSPPKGYRIDWPAHRARRAAALARRQADALDLAEYELEPELALPPPPGWVPPPAADAEIWNFMTAEIRARRQPPPPQRDAFDFTEFADGEHDPPPLSQRRVR